MVDMTDYQRIERAIAYLAEHATEQPSLETLAAQVNLSPWHFQRLFCRWAGISPKRFLQSLTLERGKSLLHGPQPLIEIADSLGLSGGSRLYDHFVQLDAVTPGEYRRQGEGVTVEYGVRGTPFGDMFVARTARGICRAGFVEAAPLAAQLAVIQESWPSCRLLRNDAVAAEATSLLFADPHPGRGSGPLSLHVTGTNFQVAVWRALLEIPPGTSVSYSGLARALGRPRASRATGSAVGANPVALLIPCHRVIQQSGALGGYRWGVRRKQAIQAWERLRESPAAGESKPPRTAV